MKFGTTNLQTHREHIAHHIGAPKRIAPPRHKVRWPVVLCIGFCLAFWIAVLFGVTALMQ